MNRSEPTAPEIDPVAEELVAYLDDELDSAQRAEVERRLADDAKYRNRLTHLQKTWDMLDVLGRTDAGEDFTRTTVELIAVSAKEDVQQEKQAQRRGRVLVWLGAGTATLVCALLAYAAVLNQLTAPDRELLRDLPVIERLDAYTHAQSVDFLRSLEKNGLFVSESPDGPAIQEPLTERRTRVEKMTAEQKELILRKKERFAALPKEEQDRLHKLNAQIDAAEHGERLKKVMTNYHEWLKALGSQEQTAVLSVAPEQRIAKIKQVQTRQATERLKAIASELSSEDVSAVTVWLEIYVASHEREFAEHAPARFKAGLQRLPPDKRIAAYVDGMLWRLEWWPESLPRPTTDELAFFVSLLSPNAQSILEEADTFDHRWQDAQEFIRQVLVSKRTPRLSEEELRKFAATLPPSERELLETKSPEVMKEMLRVLHWKKNNPRPGPGGEGFGPGGGPGGGGFRPPGK